MGLKKHDKLQLKEQFKKLLDILIIKDSTCEIHTEFYCDRLYDCCVDKSVCRECTKKCKVKAEITFENTSEDYRRFYVFGKKDKRKYVNSINSMDDIYAELEFLNENCIGNMDESDLKYFRKVDSLEKYAKEFFLQVIEECFPLVNKDILPIKFHQFLQNWKDYSNKMCSLGVYYKYQNQNIINIYETGSLEVEKIKINIKHEILHYALDMNNLKYDDDTGVFHALCKIYDAGAYKPMDEQEQHIYNTFVMAYEGWDSVQDIYEAKQITQKDYIQALIIQAGSKDDTVKKQFEELGKRLKQARENDEKLKQVSGM